MITAYPRFKNASRNRDAIVVDPMLDHPDLLPVPSTLLHATSPPIKHQRQRQPKPHTPPTFPTSNTFRTRLSDVCSPNQSLATSTGWRCWAAAAARACRRRSAVRARTGQLAVRVAVAAVAGWVGGAAPFAECRCHRWRPRPSPGRDSRLGRIREAGGQSLPTSPNRPAPSNASNKPNPIIIFAAAAKTTPSSDHFDPTALIIVPTLLAFVFNSFSS